MTTDLRAEAEAGLRNFAYGPGAGMVRKLLAALQSPAPVVEREDIQYSPVTREAELRLVSPVPEQARSLDWRLGEGGYKSVATLYEVSDYDGGDPALEIGERADGSFDLIVTKGGDDITLWSVPRIFIDKIGQSLRLAALTPPCNPDRSSSGSGDTVQQHENNAPTTSPAALSEGGE